MAYRPLGFIPGKLGNIIPKIEYRNADLGMIRTNDWHHVSKFILSDVYKMQSFDHIPWNYKGRAVRLHIPTMFIIGDIEGHDKLCGRKSGHGVLMKGVTHSCNIKRNECDNPNAKCRLLHEDEITSLQDIAQDEGNPLHVIEDAKGSLNEKGYYYNVRNAFAGMNFGANPHGLHGAVAICLLHTFQQKFPNLVVQEYLNLFGVSEDTSGSLQLNSSLPRLITMCKRQSDRDYPRLNTFSFSLTKGKHSYFACEKYARVFALYLFSLTTYGWNFAMKNMKTSKYDEKDAMKVLKCLEFTLTIYQYLFQENFDKTKSRIGEKEVRKYLQSMKIILDYGRSQEDLKKKKETCKFPKFHALTHIIPMILEFGSAKNFDGGPNESHHKYLAKAPADRTQGRDDTFDEQTCYNLSSQILLEQVSKSLNVMKGKRSGTSRALLKRKHCTNEYEKVTEPKVNHYKVHKQSAKFTIECNNEKKSIDIIWDYAQTGSKFDFDDTVKEFVYKQIFQSEEGVTDYFVDGFTDLVWNGNIIRAHPSYRSGMPWHDYINVIWNGDSRKNSKHRFYVCPAKVLMFLDLSTSKFKRDINDESNDIPSTIDLFAVIHSTATKSCPYVPTDEAQKIHSLRGKPRIATYWTLEKEYHLVKVTSIDSLAFVIQDYKDQDMLDHTEYVIEIKPKSSWASVHE